MAKNLDKSMQDCYFYFYSTCTKGEHCGFRHEPSALGCETMCPLWLEGKCQMQNCHMRHMELKKNRKTIPCYWETQPSGCRKPHCPFLHKSQREPPQTSEPDKQECPAPVAAASAPLQDPLLVSFQERMHLY